jgi:hypothetical protein
MKRNSAILLVLVSGKHATFPSFEIQIGSIDSNKLQDQSNQHGAGWLAMASANSMGEGWRGISAMESDISNREMAGSP